MILLLDMDGPLADFDRHFYEKCTELGYTFDVPGIEHQKHRFFTEHMVNYAERKAAREMVDSAGWFEQLPVTPGAIDGVRELLDFGVDVWVCTKPLEVNPTCRDAKAAWLREHFPELERKLIVAPDKALVTGDVLLDDAPHLGQVERASWRPIVFTAPYNGEGSEWVDLPHWHWTDGVDLLLSRMRHPSMQPRTGIPPLPPLLAWSEHPSNPAAQHEAFLKEYRSNLQSSAPMLAQDPPIYGNDPTGALAETLVGLKALLHDHERVTTPEPAPGEADTTNPKDLLGIKKPQLHLVPRSAIIRMAQAMADGAAKYGPYNWREKAVRATVYQSAADRHLAAWLDGEDHATDSGYHHLAHAAACLAILIDAIETGNLVDDRPTPGAAGRLIAELTEK
jgi:5'(3')-deoxyribonucleotidase